MAQRTFSKMGRVNVMAALCAALAAFLASGPLLAAVAGPFEATFAGATARSPSTATATCGR